MKKQREKPIAESKIKTVKEIIGFLGKKKTFMIVSINGIPGSQFQEIKKKLKGKAIVKVIRKSLLLRSLGEANLEKLKKYVHEDIALLFSDLDSFELSSILSENQSPAKAKTGQEALENIIIHAGGTDLPPGPAISELGAVGLKVKVEEGKIAIQEDKIIVKKGEKISENVSSVLAKLNIAPFKVGFVPEVSYEKETSQVYEDIAIDKEDVLENLKTLSSKALAFAVKIGYICKETILVLIRKAGAEEKKLSSFVKEETQTKSEEESQK